MTSSYTFVSFIVVARNARKHIPAIFSDFLAQDYSGSDVEFLFVDSMSTDATWEYAAEFASKNPEIKFKMFRNPAETLSAGWNVALGKALGQIILRIDAHARIPKDFISNNVREINAGQSIVGGVRVTRLPDSLFPRLMASAEASVFGAGSAAFRRLGVAKYVDTLAHAAYSRKVFQDVGGYNEMLVRNQDVEIHYRMKKAGYKFWFNPQIWSEHAARDNFYSLLKQKFENGYWIAIVSAISPRCFGLRHFVPFLFFVALVVAIVFSVYGILFPIWLLLSVYFFFAVLFAVRAVIGERFSVMVLGATIPALFFFMHFAYGLGTFCGILGLPAKWRKLHSYKPPFPL